MQLKLTKAERTRQFIIEKSASIFNTKGIAGTAMSDIMDVTKLAKGSLYVHFEDKEDLSYCAVDYALKKFSDSISEAVDKQKTSKAKLTSFVENLSNPRDPAFSGGCPLLNFGMEADDTNLIIKKKVALAIESVQIALARIVRAGIERGEFRKEWHAEKFAVKAFAMIEGGILMSRVGGNKDKMKIIMKAIKGEIEENSI